MEIDESIILIDAGEIIRIVRRTLSKIDPRLVDHGERVAYIAHKIYEQCPDRSDFDFSKLFVLCLLHDIGAYKTNEIDDMVRFETEVPFDHALYGYLFLKNTTHLADYAEALLYHHTDYAALKQKNCRCARYAEMIHLADRVDILLHASKPDLNNLRPMAGTRFHPDDVEALLAAARKEDLMEALRSGAYQADIPRFSDSLTIGSGEILDYLKLLVYAIDFRSPYTVTHTADTTIISLETGKLLGLGAHDLQALYIGAFLHDIGKIAIPHDILEKPGRLTPEEFAVIQRHIPEGEEILRGVVSDEICNIALRHHEKLDGSGYARGLTEQALTFPERIVAVSDILGALTQRRSYKEPFPKEKTLAILNQMKDAGKLCRRVVDTVSAQYDLILYNTEKSHDPVKQLYANLVNEYADRCAELGKAPASILSII